VKIRKSAEAAPLKFQCFGKLSFILGCTIGICNFVIICHLEFVIFICFEFCVLNFEFV
jgi:hypothetical protein